MLITLVSNNDADANRFTNFFPEGLQIDPNSEVGLVNASFTLHRGYTIDNTNNVITAVQLGNAATPFNVVVVNGFYQTLEDLAAIIQQDIRNAYAFGASPRILGLFPATGATTHVDNVKGGIQCNFRFDPVNIKPYKINLNDAYNGPLGDAFSQARRGEMSNLAKGSGGNMLNTNLTNSWNLCGFSTHFGTTDFKATPMRLENGASHMSCELSFKISARGPAYTNNADYFSFRLDKNSTPGLGPIGNNLADYEIRLKDNVGQNAGNLEIRELISGVSTDIMTAGQYWEITDTLIMVVPAAYPNMPTDRYVHYYKEDAAGVRTEYQVGNNRNPVQYTDDFFVKGDFFQRSAFGSLEIGDSTDAEFIIFKEAGVPTKITGLLNNAGGYIAGEEIQVWEDDGAGNLTDRGGRFLCKDISNTGQVTEYDCLAQGAGYNIGPIAFIGAQSATQSAGTYQATAGNSPSLVLTAAGTGYTDGQTLAVQGASGVTFQVAVTAGVVTRAVVVNPGTGDLNDGDVLTLVGGNNDATILVNHVIARVNIAENLAANIADDVPNNSLQVINSMSVDFGNLRSILGYKAQYDVANVVNVLSNLLVCDAATMNPNGPELGQEMVVHLDNHLINSREKNTSGKAIAVLAVGEEGVAIPTAGSYFTRPYNLIYHPLKNKHLTNHNEMSIRITNSNGALFQGLYHPTRVTLDVRQGRY